MIGFQCRAIRNDTSLSLSPVVLGWNVLIPGRQTPLIPGVELAERSSVVMVLAKSGAEGSMGDGRGPRRCDRRRPARRRERKNARVDIGNSEASRTASATPSAAGWCAGEVTSGKVSDIKKSVCVAIGTGASYIMRWLGFFGPFALDSEGLFGEIAHPNRIRRIVRAPPRPPATLPDRWRDSHHRRLTPSAPKERGVCRRLGARDPVRVSTTPARTSCRPCCLRWRFHHGRQVHPCVEPFTRRA